MRISALAILATAAFLATAPARAQTYNPDYPVCLQVNGVGGSYIACGYTSLEQCAQSVSGRAAQCIINPILRARTCLPDRIIGGIVTSARYADLET
jgi:hypothetical protein